MQYLTIRLEATNPKHLNHVPAQVFISRNGKRKSYWCETGLFWPHESKQAEDYANRLRRKGIKTTIISQTFTSP